jgi:hypothetical protein
MGDKSCDSQSMGSTCEGDGYNQLNSPRNEMIGIQLPLYSGNFDFLAPLVPLVLSLAF